MSISHERKYFIKAKNLVHSNHFQFHVNYKMLLCMIFIFYHWSFNLVLYYWLSKAFQTNALVRRCYIFGTCSNPSMADPYFNRSSKSAVLAVCVPLSAARIVILSFRSDYLGKQCDFDSVASASNYCAQRHRIRGTVNNSCSVHVYKFAWISITAPTTIKQL